MECTCKECISGCWHNPGWFGSIEEVEGAARLKDMDTKEFIKEYLIREWYVDERVEIPAPRRNFSSGDDMNDLDIQNNGRGFIRASWGHNLMRGYPCIFLTDEDRCSIHSTKPLECKKADCKGGFIDRIDIEEYWRNHQEWLLQFIGDE